MPIQIVRHDITKMAVDAIVTTGNRHLRAGHGVNGAIHKAAGPQLQIAAQKLGGCGVGEAKITPGFDLPSKYVVHTVSPVWRGTEEDRKLLADCYTASLQLAVENGCHSIAFPLIASGAHGCPRAEALRIATDAIGRFLLMDESEPDLQVFLVVFTKESLLAGSKLVADVRQYIDDFYVEENFDSRGEGCRAKMKALNAMMLAAPAGAPSLEDALDQLEESFAQMLLRLISERGMSNAQCYRKANVDRKTFSKIVTNEHLKPQKRTALALAIALKLTLEETNALLATAGYTLSRSSRFDVIVEYFIQAGRYDLMEINETLYDMIGLTLS